jgi:hypothetical protein
LGNAPTAKFSMNDTQNNHDYFLNFHGLDPMARTDSKLILKELTCSVVIIVVNLRGRKVVLYPSTFMSHCSGPKETKHIFLTYSSLEYILAYFSYFARKDRLILVVLSCKALAFSHKVIMAY